MLEADAGVCSGTWGAFLTRAGGMEAAGLGGALGPRGWSRAQERPGCELPGFPMSRQEPRVGEMRPRETDCTGGEGAARVLALTRWQREGAEGAACTQRGQTLRSGQRGSGKDARSRGHPNRRGQQQQPQWWQLGRLTGHL